VIYFSLGSLVRAETLPKDKLEAFISVFSELPQRVVWKIDDIVGLPDNVRTSKWYPQFEILSKLFYKCTYSSTFHTTPAPLSTLFQLHCLFGVQWNVKMNMNNGQERILKAVDATCLKVLHRSSHGQSRTAHGNNAARAICSPAVIRRVPTAQNIDDSKSGIATGYGLDDPGSIPSTGKFFFSPQRPNWLWGPPSFLANGYWELYSGGKAAGAWIWPLTSI
jgi:hypothetical protein